MDANSSTAISLWSHPVIFKTRMMFYIVTPEESSVRTLKEVPNYVTQAVPVFFTFILIELILLAVQGRTKRWPRTNDAFSSVGAGVISQLPMLVARNIELSAYILVYEKWCLVELPWDSAWTWWLSLLGVDLGYYWVHRMAHEVNFLWAGHQVHHSSEDYNLSTALRQSVLQRYGSWVFYLPLALAIPPPIFLVHLQLNLIYQFWIHTELVDRLGPLEYIMNTPSHHRVHHGRNRYCIDTNYAGVLIIWDRMFGTFEPENPKDEVVYGLVHPLNSWDPIYTQLCHWKHIVKTAWGMEGLDNKVNTVLNGPGWQPGKPRTGLREDIPDIHAPQKRYNKSVSSTLINIYLWIHFFIILGLQQFLQERKHEFGDGWIYFGIFYIIWSLTSIGYIYERRWYAPLCEVVRCAVFLTLDYKYCFGGSCPGYVYVLRCVFIVSSVIWFTKSAAILKREEKKVK